MRMRMSVVAFERNYAYQRDDVVEIRSDDGSLFSPVLRTCACRVEQVDHLPSSVSSLHRVCSSQSSDS